MSTTKGGTYIRNSVCTCTSLSKSEGIDTKVRKQKSSAQSSIRKNVEYINQMVKAARAIPPAATTADLAIRKLDAPLVPEALAADPEAVDEPEGEVADAELPLAPALTDDEPATGGAGVVPLGWTVKVELLI